MTIFLITFSIIAFIAGTVVLWLCFVGDPNICPIHKIPYYHHGYDDLRGCEMCDKEREVTTNGK